MKEVLDLHGGIFFVEKLANDEAERQNLAAVPFAPLSSTFKVIALAQQHTIIGWVVVRRTVAVGPS